VCDAMNRERVLAILGTGIANVEHQTPKSAKRRRA
jgi:hypothetical protein